MAQPRTDRKRRVTLRDVALAADVHPSTVSRIISAPSGADRIPDETIARVVAVARSLGYRRNMLAAGLRMHRSYTFGVIVTDISNPTMPPLLLAMERVMAPAGYVPMIAHLDPASPNLVEEVQHLLDRQLDGVILASSADPQPVLDVCAQAGVPAVVVFDQDDAVGYSLIRHDDITGIDLVARHLLSLGHRRIAHIAGPQALSTGRKRLAAFRGAMAAAGMDPAQAPVAVAESYTRAAGRAACEALLRLKPRPTAILAAHDLLALGSLDAMAAAGLSCPGDVSLTGYDDIPNMDLIAPPLTTVQLDFSQLGTRAAEMLLAALETGNDVAAGQYEVAPQLVVRGSTQAPKLETRPSGMG